MAITHTLLEINGTPIRKLVDYEIEWAKLWKDADRNMNGDVRATLVGVFPKIKCKTRTGITKPEIMELGRLLNMPYLTVRYYDHLTDSLRTASYYASDFSTKLMEREREMYYEASFNLIPVSKM